MSQIPLKSLTYTDEQRKIVDTINENFNVLWWLLNQGNINSNNVQPERLIPMEPDLPQVIDTYGLDPEFIKFHPNKVCNSGFELTDSTGKPYYWDTTGDITEASNFEDTVALELTAGEYALQKSVGGIGLWDTSWWAWCLRSRVSLRVRSSAIGGLIKCEVLDASGVAQPLDYWVYDREKRQWGKTITKTGAHYIQYNVANEWVNSFRSFAVIPPVAGEMRIKLTNTGTTTIYLDAVSVEPDWNGRWPSFYTNGPRSHKSERFFVQPTEPSGPMDKDIWWDTDARPYKGVYIPSSGMMRDGITPDIITSKGGIKQYGFDGAGTVEESLYTSIDIPQEYNPGSEIHLHIHYQTPTAANANIIWGIEYSWINVDGVFPTTTILTAVSAMNSVADKHYKTPNFIISGIGQTVESILQLRVFRQPGNTSDTYTSDAVLLGVELHFESLNPFGTETEFPV